LFTFPLQPTFVLRFWVSLVFCWYSGVGRRRRQQQQWRSGCATPTTLARTPLPVGSAVGRVYSFEEKVLVWSL
jgi:hypothetical protein